MPEVKDLDQKMLNQSLKNIDALLEDEEDQDIISFLQVAKDSLEIIKRRKGMN